MDKAHIQHGIGFIEHKNLNLVELAIALVHQIDQAARCGHQNMHAAIQRLHLRANINAAKYHHRAQRHMAAIGLEAVAICPASSLVGAGSRRVDGGVQSLATFIVSKDMQQRQAERRRFAGAGLGHAHQVMTINNGVYTGFLNRCGGVVAFFFYSAQQGSGQLEARKIGHMNSLSWSHN